MRTLTLLACATTGLLLTLSGCESTVDAARKLAARGTKAFAAHGLSVTRIDRRIRILSTTIVHDANGTAAVVSLRNDGPHAMADAPITIDVLDPSGRTVFENDSPGAEYDLTHVPLLAPGETVTWVNDQVLPSGTAARVRARVGPGRDLHGAPPRIDVSSTALVDDVNSGWEVTGHVRNASRVDQLHLVLFAIARRGERVVSAGRAILARLAAGKSAIFHAYLLGNPRGARISVSAPPSDTT
jgi:hypothetical protein